MTTKLLAVLAGVAVIAGGFAIGRATRPDATPPATGVATLATGGKGPRIAAPAAAPRAPALAAADAGSPAVTSGSSSGSSVAATIQTSSAPAATQHASSPTTSSTPKTTTKQGSSGLSVIGGGSD
jgi:hypothetical protein